VVNATAQKLCVWSGLAMLAIFLVGFVVIGGMVPPPSPGDSAQKIATFYAEKSNRIHVGLVVSLFGTALCYPWAAVISVQLKRIEGLWSPLTYTQLATGLTTGIFFAVPLFTMGAASYRPTAAPDVTRALNDLGWLLLVGIVGPAVIECLSIGIAVLTDHRESPIFPRWVGYFNIWVAVFFCGGGLDICFKSGPFAWNGAFAFYIPLAIFGLWFAVMTKALLDAINRQRDLMPPDSVPVVDEFQVV
jgi:hypothetical protein